MKPAIQFAVKQLAEKQTTTTQNIKSKSDYTQPTQMMWNEKKKNDSSLSNLFSSWKWYIFLRPPDNKT